MRYTAKGHHNRQFELFDENEQLLGSLDYISWFTIKARITLNNNESYEITNSSIWLTAIHVMHGDAALYKLHFNWKGQIIITRADDTVYILTHTRRIKGIYSLTSSNGEELVSLKPDFQFAKLSFNYSIEVNEGAAEPADPLVILLCIYSVNHKQQILSGGVFSAGTYQG